MAITRKKNLGLLLIEAGIIEPEQLEQALLKQSKEINSGYIGDILIGAGLIDEKTRNRFLSQQLHIPTIELGHFNVDKSVLGMIPERIVREYNVLPIFNLNNTINVAITDPIDPDPINAARNASGLKAEPIIVTANELQSAIDIYYGMSTLSGFEDENISIDDIDDTRIVQLVDNIIEMSKNHIIAQKNVTMNEDYFKGHFPGKPIMPGVLQIEAMAQAGGVLCLNSFPDPENYLTFFAKIDNAKFKLPVVPGDTLIFRLELLSPIRRGIMQMKGQAFVDGKLTCEAELLAKIIKKSEA